MSYPLLTRPWTDQQSAIARLICTVVVENGRTRGLSYAEIGKELGGLSEHTVRGYVKAMANNINGLDALPPRLRIWMVTRHPSIAEAIRAEAA